MKVNKDHLNLNQESGSVFIELALILPLVFVITLTAFEYTRAIHRLSIATSASKEFANIVMRECPQDDISACLEAQRVIFQGFMETIVPGTELMVTQLLPTGLENNATWTVSATAANPISSAPASRINNLFSGNQLRAEYSYMDRHERIFFSECYIPYSPIIRFVNSIFNLPFVEGSYLYDATII